MLDLEIASLSASLFDYFGLDSRSHVLGILDEIERGVPSSDQQKTRPSLN